jgi:N-acyl-D-amino-acid deacylase
VLDLLIRGGEVVDGSGAAARRADVLVRDGRIHGVVAGGCPTDPPAKSVIDATGHLVTPGFVDIHTHSDLTLLSAPAAPSTVRQGITTAVVGNCGLGVFPAPGGAADLGRLRAAVSYLDLDPEVAWSWRDFAGYAAALAAVKPSVEVGVLVGHLPLHAVMVGYEDRPPTSGELDAMCRVLDDQLAAGALGLSTGLAYAPLTTVRESELLALARVVAAHDGLFAWHLRDYADDLLPSVETLLRVARQAGCRTQISHLVVVGRRNWGRAEQVLERVDQALVDGLDVGVDIYPYLFGNCPLSQLLPDWAQRGGVDGMTAAVRDDATRAKIRHAWLDRPIGWDEVTVSRMPATSADRSGRAGPPDRGVAQLGRSVAEFAAVTGRDADDVALDLLAEHGNDVMVTVGGRDNADVRAVLGHRSSVVASDGQGLDPDGPTGRGVPHPRSYGCFPRLLADYTGRGGLTLAEAVRKSTSAPAARIGLRDRGLIREGLRADLVVVDPHRVRDRAGYADPHRHPAGIPAVVVGGIPVVRDDAHTGAGPGTVVTRRRME